MLSKCGSCGGFMWEVSEEEPNGAAFKKNFIRCVTCKVPIAALDYFDTFSELKKIEKSITNLNNSVSEASNAIAIINENLRRLFQR